MPGPGEGETRQAGKAFTHFVSVSHALASWLTNQSGGPETASCQKVALPPWRFSLPSADEFRSAEQAAAGALGTGPAVALFLSVLLCV